MVITMIEIWLRKGIVIAMLFTVIVPVSAFCQQDDTGLELDGNISKAAYSVAQNHFDLAEEELAKGNYSGADYHWNLGGMSQDEISKMVRGERTLSPQDKEKLQSDAGNCIIRSMGSVSCMK